MRSCNGPHAIHGERLCVTASFGDATLVHVANVAVPGIEITLLDTGYLFAETEWFADDLRAGFGLNVRVMYPAADLEPNVWQTNTEACCAARKVEPMNRALAGRDAWVTGLRRADSPVASHHTDRPPGSAEGRREDQPARRVDRRRCRRVRRTTPLAGTPPCRPRLPVDRVLAVHTARPRRR